VLILLYRGSNSIQVHNFIPYTFISFALLHFDNMP